MKVTLLADMVNEYCDEGKYFWACGLVKETVAVWKSQENIVLLNEPAQGMAKHYVEADNDEA